MLQGIDVSSYQSGTFSTTGLSFVFIKVTEGKNYTNPNWLDQLATARAAHLVVGFYHYPHIGNGAETELNYFLSRVKPALQEGDMLCLDWEWYGQTTVNSAARTYKDDFVAGLRDKAPKHRIVVYSDVNNWTGVDTDGNCGDALWIATGGRQAGQPGIKDQWTFHQYTDSPEDRDVANPALFSTIDDLRAWAKFAQVTKQIPVEEDMPQWINHQIQPSTKGVELNIPAGTAWTNYPHRTIHLGFDEVGTPNAEAQVRVALSDGKEWKTIVEEKVTAAGNTIDVAADGMKKVSIVTDKPICASIEVY